MATPHNPDYQPYPPQGQAAYPPQVDYGHPPQNQGASAQYPSPPTVQGYPPQCYPPTKGQDDLPPAYPTTQGPPPAYVYQPDQPAYNYQQPQLANATVVVAAQPVTATTTSVSPPEENHSGIAICALVFSLCTLFTYGSFLICLSLSIPALILAIVALGTRGRSQKNKAGISIGLNIGVVVLTVVFLVAVGTPAAVFFATSVATATPTRVPSGPPPSYYVRTRSCSSYYSSSYNTYCVPHSYSTLDGCRYYQSSYSGHCPSTSTYRCPNFYTSTYGSCIGYGYTSCYYYSSSVPGYCPSSAYRSCDSYYSYTYSTRCVASSSSTRSSTPCSFYASYYSGGGHCPT